MSWSFTCRKCDETVTLSRDQTLNMALGHTCETPPDLLIAEKLAAEALRAAETVAPFPKPPICEHGTPGCEGKGEKHSCPYKSVFPVEEPKEYDPIAAYDILKRQLSKTKGKDAECICGHPAWMHFARSGIGVTCSPVIEGTCPRCKGKKHWVPLSGSSETESDPLTLCPACRGDGRLTGRGECKCQNFVERRHAAPHPCEFRKNNTGELRCIHCNELLKTETG